MPRIATIKEFIKLYVNIIGFCVLVGVGLTLATIGVSYMLLGDYETSINNGGIAFVITFWCGAGIGLPVALMVMFLTPPR